MDNETLDEKQEDIASPESSTDQTDETVGADDTTPEPRIPKSRFDEVNTERKLLKEQLDALTKAQKETPPADEQERRAQEYIRNEVKRTLADLDSAQAAAQREAKAKLQEEVDELSANPKFKEKDVLTFMQEEGLEELPLAKVFNLWLRAGSKPTKARPRVPGSTSTDENRKPVFDEKTLQEKPLHALIEEYKKKVGFKQ